MTPHPHPHPRRVPMPRQIVQRITAMIAAVLVIGAAPLVAHAIADESPADTVSVSALNPTLNVSALNVPEPRLAQRPVDSIPDLGADLEVAPDAEITPAAAATPEPVDVAAERVVDPVIALLADTYVWDEQTPQVAELQETLGVAADGRYGIATQQAHRMAAEFVGLPIESLPVPELPPGPDPSEWEALRQCESNGNYAITSSTGKYRGAYQFDRTTWNSVAGRHAPHLVGVDPAAAAPADQDAMALALYSERGASPWPHCGRHLS